MSPTLLRGQHDRVEVRSGPRPGIPSQMRIELTSKSQAGPGIVAGREALGLATETAGSARHLLMIICNVDN